MRYPIAIAAVLIASLSAGSADAFQGCGGGGLWAPYNLGIGGLYRSLHFPTDRRVPYFAAHPPVYYRHPVPRTYGYSPFAYTPTTMTPEVVTTVAPVEIINPYVPSSSDESAEKPERQESSESGRSRPVSTGSEADVVTPSGIRVRSVGPMTILNPFVESNGKSKTI